MPAGSKPDSIGHWSAFCWLPVNNWLMNKHLLMLALLLLSIGKLSAQSDTINYLYQQHKQGLSGVTIESVYQSFNYYGNSFGMYVTPHFTFQTKNGILLNGSVSLGQTHLTSSRAVGNQNLNHVAFHIVTLYPVNDRLRVGVSVFHSQNKNRQPIANPKALQFTESGASVTMQYKVSDNFSFEAGVQFQNTETGFGGMPLNRPASNTGNRLY